MTVLSFSFEDNLWNWTLSPTDFGLFNLLVGASGVGKTRILTSLHRIREAALGNARSVADCAWTLKLSEQGQIFVWSARMERASKQLALDGLFSEHTVFERNEKVWFAKEIIQLEGGPIIFQRDSKGIVLNGNPLPRIKNTESAINLLPDEETIQPIRRAMQRFRFSEAGDLSSGLFERYDRNAVDRASAYIHSLDDLRDNNELDIIAKAMLLQNMFPNDFRRVVDQYRDIFGYVDEIRIAPLSEFQRDSKLPARVPFEFITVAVREREVPKWIIGPSISSGMFRTLIHLLELALAPAGTVVLIDEFENSLGVNCLPQVAEHMLGRARDLQFIITSHHPYVINNVPPEMWRVVTRRGSVVRVRDHRDLPALNTGSRHDKFTILNNLPEFEQGVE